MLVDNIMQCDSYSSMHEALVEDGFWKPLCYLDGDLGGIFFLLKELGKGTRSPCIFCSRDGEVGPHDRGIS